MQRVSASSTGKRI